MLPSGSLPNPFARRGGERAARLAGGRARTRRGRPCQHLLRRGRVFVVGVPRRERSHHERIQPSGGVVDRKADDHRGCFPTFRQQFFPDRQRERGRAKHGTGRAELLDPPIGAPLALARALAFRGFDAFGAGGAVGHVEGFFAFNGVDREAGRFHELACRGLTSGERGFVEAPEPCDLVVFVRARPFGAGSRRRQKHGHRQDRRQAGRPRGTERSCSHVHQGPSRRRTPDRANAGVPRVRRPRRVRRIAVPAPAAITINATRETGGSVGSPGS